MQHLNEESPAGPNRLLFIRSPGSAKSPTTELERRSRRETVSGTSQRPCVAVYLAVVEALRRGRLGVLFGSLSAGFWLVLAVTARFWFRAPAERLWALSGVLGMPCFLVGMLAGVDWYTTARKRFRRSLALSFMTLAGAFQVAASRALLLALRSHSPPKAPEPTLSQWCLIGALIGASLWLVTERAAFLVLELPVVATSRMNRFLQALRTIRHTGSHLCELWMHRLFLYVAFLAMLLLLASVRASWRSMLVELFPLTLIVLSLLTSWGVALILVRIVLSSPVVFDCPSELTQKGSSEANRVFSGKILAPMDRGGGEMVVQPRALEVAQAGQASVLSTPSLVPTSASLLPSPSPSEGRAAGWFLLLTLEQSLVFQHVDIFLLAFYDLERVALVASPRRQALFADPHGTILLAFVDLCLAVIEPHALAERYTPSTSARSFSKKRSPGTFRWSNGCVVQLYRMACATLGAFALHSHREDTFGLIQRRWLIIQQRLQELSEALIGIRSRRGALRPACRLEQRLFHALEDSVQQSQRWISLTTKVSMTLDWPDSSRQAQRYQELIRCFLSARM